MELSEFEKDILRCLDGEDVPGLVWGAAMSEAVEYLFGCGCIARDMAGGSATYRTTPTGRAALEKGDAK